MLFDKKFEFTLTIESISISSPVSSRASLLAAIRKSSLNSIYPHGRHHFSSLKLPSFLLPNNMLLSFTISMETAG
jgi:hypothetical protein